MYFTTFYGRNYYITVVNYSFSHTQPPSHPSNIRRQS